MAIKIDLILKLAIICMYMKCNCVELSVTTPPPINQWLNQPCVNKCIKYNNTVCYDKICYCNVNYIWNNDTLNCELHDCANDVECRDYDPNRVCLKRKCMCFTYYEESTEDPYLCRPTHPPELQFLWFLTILPVIIVIVVLCCYFRREKQKKFTFRIETTFDRDILFNPRRDQLFTITPSQSPMFASPQSTNLPAMSHYTEPTLIVPTHSRNVPQNYPQSSQSVGDRASPPPYSPRDPLQPVNNPETPQSYGFNPQHIYTKQIV